MSESFNDHVFRSRVDSCLEQTRKVLHRTKQLTTPEAVVHRYSDKYLIADYLGNSAIISYVNCLSKMGLSSADLSILVSWSRSRDIFLRLEENDTCLFVKEVKRDVVDPTRQVTEVSGFGMISSGLITSKQITTVTDYVYEFKTTYELVAYRGVGDKIDDRIVLQSRSSQQSLVMTSSFVMTSYPETSNHHFEVNISWLLRCIEEQSMQAAFSIDREREDCHTPARNQQVSAALDFFRQFRVWSCNAHSLIRDHMFHVQCGLSSNINDRNVDLDAINSEDVLVPVVPLVFDTPSGEGEGEGQREGQGGQLTSAEEAVSGPSVTLTGAVVSQLLSEQARSLEEKCEKMSKIFPPSSSTVIISEAEAKLLVVMRHMNDIAEHYADGIQHIENMLRDQLVAAVGKILEADHFTEYMRYHNRKLFKEVYQPRPFSHAVRRTAQHSPEGTIRIEQHLQGALSEPIYTACSSRAAGQAAPMQFALNASTNVTFGGDRHLHTWLAHSFSGQQQPELKLVAQARQFSSFIVLIGRIASAHVFEPKYGMIVQNRDEVTIPLTLEQIPTPKEFRDAIESLSPEQQRFAKAFRGMQLESTLFGVLVLQIKPQLEKVLKLSTDSLTKEIRLTQDLMQLFIKYQIPSDLLSFEDMGGNEVHSPHTRLSGVKTHVTLMQQMISDCKDKEAEDRAREVLYDNPLADMNLRYDKGGFDSSEESCDESPGAFRSGSSRKQAPLRSGAGPRGMFGMMTMTTLPTPPPAMRLECKEKSRSLATPTMAPHPCPPPCSAPGGPPKVMSIDVKVSGGKEGAGPPPVRQTEETIHRDRHGGDGDVSICVPEGDREEVDFTKYPGLLDRRYDELDPDSALRPTILNPGDTWTKKSYKSLMSPAETQTLGADELSTERIAAFDLLDALTRSGGLVIECASLHVVIAATHCFDKSLMDTVVQGNINPIERVERSALIMAGAIHGVPTSELVACQELLRVLTYSPQLK